jgi:ATP-dependent DNA helicase RecG
MKSLGYVNRYGRGVETAQAALRENGNPEAVFAFEPTYFLATVGGKP